MSIYKMVRQALASRYLSLADETRLRALIHSDSCEVWDIEALVELREAIAEGLVLREREVTSKTNTTSH